LSGKVRLDNLLVDMGLAPTRNNARALIMAGSVVVDDHAADKAGQLVSPEASVRLKGEYNPYVSRGGLKLEAALDRFPVDPTGLVCVDIGASTGGFTDCLLQRGAAKVFAVDVGYGQLAWKLRDDTRVVSLERRNFRTMDLAEFSDKIRLAVIDASFISVTLFIDKVYALLEAPGAVIVLVKPQFEVERGQVGKGGVVKDQGLREGALEKVCAAARVSGFSVAGSMESPVPGAKKGNVEFLVHLKKEQD
jgi:23S rRNA (cytidine1920-2'-O)/16S rRNA (cytidine1409-2'-O)-methyltransferase